MIYHYKDNININNIIIKSKLKYGDGYIFNPIKIDKNNFVIETPKLYIPYKIKNINNKNYITLSFQNKEYNKDTLLFYNLIIKIYNLIKIKYKNLIEPFKNKDHLSLKIIENHLIYNQYQKRINNIPTNTYRNFIIHLYGIWDINGEKKFQWHLLQSKINMPLYLDKYSFKNEKKGIPPPPPPPLPKKIKSLNYFKKNYKNNKNK